MTKAGRLLNANKFPLLRRLSIASLVAMLITATILILLYRQDQLADHENIAAQNNEKAATHLMHLLDDQIYTLITISNRLDNQALRTNPIGLFPSALDLVREYDILKLKIYNLSGTTIYSSAGDEIGGTTMHPELLAMALSGEKAHKMEFRDAFLSATGEIHDVYVALAYMPLTHEGKRIGAIEIYADANPVFERLKTNTIKIALIVFCSFTALFVALFFYVRKTDRAVAEWQRAIAETKAELHIAAIAFETQEGMIVTDASGVILRVNHAFTDITGYTAEEAIGQTPRLLKSGRQNAAFYDTLWKDLLLLGGWQGEMWNRRKNGEAYPEYLTITAVKGDNDEVAYYVATMNDITERKLVEKQIHDLAFYDALTQLPNRRLLNDRLEQTIATSTRSGRYGALIFLDLDNFKPLNDTHGHHMGDLLLQEAAHRISSCVREIDTVARFGGDEFVVILSELDVNKTNSITQAGIVAEKIRATLSNPYVLKTQHGEKTESTVEHLCTSSLGVVLFINHEGSVADILKWADIAMYQAKAAGRNLIRFYDAKT